MPDLLLLALLLAAVAIGWWLGRREKWVAREPPATTPLAREYFVGLNYLLNDQQDRAIETFIGALEVNSDTIETHLALGNLFRQRGEADRAVKVHQNLLARPAMTQDQSERVQLELARDFLHLGLLDRAERLLQGLIKEAHNGELRITAKRSLVDLLEREGEWQAAVNIALPGLVREHEDIRRAASHWLCELAEHERHSASPVLARRHLKQALATDPRCVRANLMLADMSMHTGHYRQAIKLLDRIPEQDPAFIPTLLAPLARAYRLLDDEAGLIRHLQGLLDKGTFTSVVVMLADSLCRHHGNTQAALSLIVHQLDQTPSLGGLDYLLRLYQQDEGPEDQRMNQLQQLTGKLLQALPRHRCRRCGFSGELLHWQCPRCRKWGTTKPLSGVESE
ncbi:lipopolysaccharide assembly protein LapB [Halomonas sp. 18H]|uniref:lipopolysaccharide assembly protein LapB n=1 Tax=Halomonas almeriensis TaxID=308163 RepID=UPI00222EDC35|nr:MULTISPECIES: lipopolysaccharide assembly protein LapB [Halomonas]MCW4153367.1 lipopolysaccharide assembly protein LapB [Halomonas sp. 18H]MDN3553794.1 lipopolysaccharide assembly protein LapB [Halomonas almeriensis]